MSIHSFYLPSLPGSRVLTSMLSLPDQPHGHGGSRLNETDPQATDSTSANDVALFGINIKAGGHQDRMSNLIEKR